MRWLLSGEQYFTQTFYAIKGSHRRGMNFTRFIGRKNIAQPTPSCILELEPERNLATFSRERVPYIRGQSWRWLCILPTFPESVLHEKELASLSDSPHSLTVFSVLSWPSVVEYRPSEGRLTHLEKNLSLHLCHRMGGITMNSWISLWRAGLFQKSCFKYQLYILWCVPMFRRRYTLGKCFSNSYETKEYFLQTGKNKGSYPRWSWGPGAHLLKGTGTPGSWGFILSMVWEYSSEVTLHNALENRLCDLEDTRSCSEWMCD